MFTGSSMAQCLRMLIHRFVLVQKLYLVSIITVISRLDHGYEPVRSTPHPDPHIASLGIILESIDVVHGSRSDC